MCISIVLLDHKTDTVALVWRVICVKYNMHNILTMSSLHGQTIPTCVHTMLSGMYNMHEQHALMHVHMHMQHTTVMGNMHVQHACIPSLYTHYTHVQ